MKTSWTFSRYDVAGPSLGFQPSTIYSVSYIKNGELLFYNGNTDHIITLKKTSPVDIYCIYFSGTVQGFEELYKDQYTEFIDPWLKDFPTFKPVLYSLEFKRPVLYDDFRLPIPPRGQEIFYVHKNKSQDDFKIFWFEKRTISKIEDLAVLDALCSWNSYGLKSSVDNQTETGKTAIVMLYESYRKGSFPNDIDLSKIRPSVNYHTFEHKGDYFEKRIYDHLLDRFEKSRKELSSSDVIDGDFGPFVPFDFDEQKLLPFIKEGKINLTELSCFSYREVIEYLSGEEKLEVHIDVQDLGIKRMTLVPRSCLLTREPSDSPHDRVYYEQMFDLDDTNLVIVDDLDELLAYG